MTDYDDVCITAVFITLKSILVVDLLGLDKLATAYGILSLLEGVGSLAGTPLIGTVHSVLNCPVASERISVGRLEPSHF